MVIMMVTTISGDEKNRGFLLIPKTLFRCMNPKVIGYTFKTLLFSFILLRYDLYEIAVYKYPNVCMNNSVTERVLSNYSNV